MNSKNTVQLRAGEKILEIIHEDFIPALPWWTFLFIWISAPFFFLVPLIQRGAEGIFFLVLMAGSGVFVALRTRFVWQRTILMVTNQRVIDVSQRGFSDRTATEVELKDIEEVTYRIKGIWPTVFRFGTIYLRTAGERADLAFCHVHKPINLYHLLTDLIKVCRL